MKQADVIEKINAQKLYSPTSHLSSITPVPLQCLLTTFHDMILKIWLDSGATVSYIRCEAVMRLGIPIKPNNQIALLADEQTRLKSMGEVDVILTAGTICLRLRALVLAHLSVECYAGNTFHVDNGVVGNLSTGSISIHGGRFQVQQSNRSGQPVAFPPPVLSLDDAKGEVQHRQAETKGGVGARPNKAHNNVYMTRPPTFFQEQTTGCHFTPRWQPWPGWRSYHRWLTCRY